MPKPPLPAELDAFLVQPNPSVIATITPDFGIHTAATWYIWEGGRAMVNMSATRKRLEYIRLNPKVSLTVLGRGEDWYHQVTLRGHAVSLEPDPDLKSIDRLSHHYRGQEYPRRGQERVEAWIEVDSWYGWAGGGPWE
jgi:PPOX class probable F420-dependent enzyme